MLIKPACSRILIVCSSSLRDQAFEPKDEPAIRCGWVVDRLLIPDKAMTVTAQIKKLIPISAITCQTSNIIGEYNANLPEVDT